MKLVILIILSTIYLASSASPRERQKTRLIPQTAFKSHSLPLEAFNSHGSQPRQVVRGHRSLMPQEAFKGHRSQPLEAFKSHRSPPEVAFKSRSMLSHDTPQSFKGHRSLPQEQAMLHHLHQPWSRPEKVPEHPRKGEAECAGGICRPKKGCRDCQYAKPIEF